MTERLYYRDAYLTRFQARVTGTSDDARVVYLDRSAFYPASGGQPFDLGTLAGVPVEEVQEAEDGVVAHRLASPVHAVQVDGEIDWRRRFDHMQQHTGQHLLSAVFIDLFGWETLSFHMGEAISTIELATPTTEPSQLECAEARANEIISENRPVSVAFEDAETVAGLRKATGRTGTIRIVSIDGLDRSACGGTHVRSTGEVGCILLRGTERIRGHVRVEFVCGARAVRRARADFRALSRIARALTASPDDAPELVEAVLERAQQAEKARAKLDDELATLRGRALYSDTAPDAHRRRVHKQSITPGQNVRAEAQGFASAGKAIFVAWQPSPTAVLLLACSNDAGIHAGNLVKRVTAQHGGRGGGSATLAQASFPSAEALALAVADIEAELSV